MLFIEAKTAFINNLKEHGKSPATLVAYNKDLDQLSDYLVLKAKVSNPNVNKITTEQLRGFLTSLQETGLTAKTVSRKLNSIKSLFKYLGEKGEVKNDPSKPISHPTITTKSARILSETEYRSLRDSAKENPRLAAMFELMLQTGIRIGEVSRLKLDDLVLKNNSQQILIKAYASSSMRIIELNDTAATAIQSYLKLRISTTKEQKKDQGYLFNTKNGSNINIRNIRSSLERVFKKAGVKNATVNDIRNTFIVVQLNKGVSPTKISQLVGHKRFSSTEKYFSLLNRKKPGHSQKLQEI